MNRTLRISCALVLAVAAVAVAPSLAAAASTFYTAPGAGATSCTESDPCSLEQSSELSEPGDQVVVGPGTYSLATEVAFKSVDVGGRPGSAAPTIVDNGHAFRAGGESAPSFHDLRIEGAGSFQPKAGSAERVSVSYTGNEFACSLDNGGSLRNMLCWAHGGGEHADALSFDAEGEEVTVSLRNVTAIAADAKGDGLDAASEDFQPKLVVDGTNVIAKADGSGHDIDLDLDGTFPPVIEVKLNHSAYASVEGEEAPFATATAPGTAGNVTAAPVFAGAAGGDFRELANSPTVNAGATEALDGVTALAGEARTLPACFGGQAVTDIGAYEFVPTVACGGPPPVPIAAPAPSNKIGFGKLKLDKAKGTATLVVKLPGAGSLTASGKGLKKVLRSATAAGQLKLPIKATGKAKKQLARTGSAKLKLSLKFTPTGGAAATTTKQITLKENLH